MNKIDLEHEKIVQAGKKTELLFAFAGLAVKCITYLVALFLFFRGVVNVIAGQDANGIGALAKLVAELHLGSILGYIWGLGATAAYVHERRGKKRMIARKSTYQKRAESSELGRTSSGLTETGDTPAIEES